MLLDAIDQLTGATTSFANLPIGTRAVALPDNSYNRASPFLAVFGRPEGASVCECERVQSASLAQSLHLINAPDIKAKLATENGRADRLAKDSRAAEDKIAELYLAAFSRLPTDDELQTALGYLAETRTDAAGNRVEHGAGSQRELSRLGVGADQHQGVLIQSLMDPTGKVTQCRRREQTSEPFHAKTEYADPVAAGH